MEEGSPRKPTDSRRLMRYNGTDSFYFEAAIVRDSFITSRPPRPWHSARACKTDGFVVIDEASRPGRPSPQGTGNCRASCLPAAIVHTTCRKTSSTCRRPHGPTRAIARRNSRGRRHRHARAWARPASMLPQPGGGYRMEFLASSP